MSMYTATVINTVATHIGAWADECMRRNFQAQEVNNYHLPVLCKKVVLEASGYQNSLPPFKIRLQQFSNDRRTFGVYEAMSLLKERDAGLVVRDDLTNAVTYAQIDSKFLLVLCDLDHMLRTALRGELNKSSEELQKDHISYGASMSDDENYVLIVVKVEQVAIALQFIA